MERFLQEILIKKATNEACTLIYCTCLFCVEFSNVNSESVNAVLGQRSDVFLRASGCLKASFFSVRTI